MPRAMTGLMRRSVIALRWAPLDVSAASLAQLRAHLSTEERARAARFRRPRARNRFVAARGWLRRVLGNELCCAAEDVPIVTAATGKPEVAGSDLRFSTSSSRNLALYAISMSTDVGVDVEAVRPRTDVERLAARFFTEAERLALTSVPAGERLAAGFQAWACKEAYGKATGCGLDFPLHAVDVWSASGEPTLAAGWSVHEVDLTPGFAAAVAGRGPLVVEQPCPAAAIDRTVNRNSAQGAQSA
jgi:4'-phosphopantetheinyl transferase